MALAISGNGKLVVADATAASGVAYLSGVADGATVSLAVVAYLSGVADGATVSLAVTMSNGTIVKLAGAKLQAPIVVLHGTGAELAAITEGAGVSTALVLDFYPL